MSVKPTSLSSRRRLEGSHNSSLSSNTSRRALRHFKTGQTQTAFPASVRRPVSSFGRPDGVRSASGFGEPDAVHLTSSFGGPDGVRSASGLGEPDYA